MYTAKWRLGAAQRSSFQHTFRAKDINEARAIAAKMQADWPGPDVLSGLTVYPAGALTLGGVA